MDLGAFKNGGLDVENNPSITKYGYDDLGDSPNNHRWRAWWRDFDAGIELRAYPVIRKTPSGAWIDELAIRTYCNTGREWGWDFPGGDAGHRFVFDDRQQSWAKATQEQAIKSLAIRLCRWSQKLAFDTEKALSRSDVLLRLRPDLGIWANAARGHIEGE